MLRALVRLSLSAAVAATSFLFAMKPVAAQADPHHPSGQEILSTTCLARLNAGAIANDRIVIPDHQWQNVGVAAKPQNDLCDSYSWVWLPGRYGFVTFEALYTGPDIVSFDDKQNAWDCSHSSVEYGVYALLPNGNYQLVQYANLFGNYVNGQCRHDGTGFASIGAPTASLYNGLHTKVAIKSWQHNDPAIGHTGAYCDDLNCWRPSNLIVDGSLYSHCSDEGQTCNFAGTREVQYGTDDAFAYGMATNGTSCSNVIFGDPKPGVRKSCSIGLRGFTFCANEWGTPTQCNFSGTKVVAFGARGSYSYGIFTNGVACNASAFGDPLPGIRKFCYVQN